MLGPHWHSFSLKNEFLKPEYNTGKTVRQDTSYFGWVIYCQLP